MPKLIFVYNANSGALNSLLGSAHKILRPDTYACHLCTLTHGVVGERSDWTRFRESVTDLHFEFLHKDEFETNYRSKWLPNYDYPIILIANQSINDLDLFMSATQINQLATTHELIKVLESSLL